MTFDRVPVLIDLALQGRGAHGAFIWGALDRQALSEARDRKRAAAQAFVTKHAFDRGHRSTLDLDALLKSV